GYAAARELARPVALRRRTAVLAREALLDDLFTRLRKEYARLEGEGPEALASLEKRLVRLGPLVAPLLARWLEGDRPGRAFAERVRDRICARCVGWLGSPQEFEREFGAQSLYAMGPLAQPVLERLRRGDDPDLQERAAVLLRRIRWRISDPLYLRLGHLLPGFETASWRQRRYEVYRLEKQGGADAVGTLREILARDPSRGVRLMAAESLARLGDVYGFEYLARAGLEPLLQSPEVKAQIAMDQGIRYLQIGRYERAIAEFETVLEIEPGNFIALYNLACAYALAGDAERACTYLERSVQAGFDDLEHIESDPDLDAIREHPRYRKVIEALRRAGTSKENESR
ncbi:MAG: tetratricopeptide repeat protein, partial [Planctomycetota bacterium]